MNNEVELAGEEERLEFVRPERFGVECIEGGDFVFVAEGAHGVDFNGEGGI